MWWKEWTDFYRQSFDSHMHVSTQACVYTQKINKCKEFTLILQQKHTRLLTPANSVCEQHNQIKPLKTLCFGEVSNQCGVSLACLLPWSCSQWHTVWLAEFPLLWIFRHCALTPILINSIYKVLYGSKVKSTNECWLEKSSSTSDPQS